MAEFPRYAYEHNTINNHSSDRTIQTLRSLAAEDPKVKVIVNASNSSIPARLF